MRNFLRSLVALAYLLAATPAPAGFVINSYALGDSPASITFVGCTANTTNNPNYTFTNHATGTAGARKTIVGVVGLDDASAFTVSGMTVGGVSATEVVEGAQELVASAIYIKDNPSGTTATIVVTFSEAITSAAVCVWAAYDIISETPVDTANQFQPASANIVLSLNTTTGGVAVGMSNANVEGSAQTWVGLTERSAAIVENATAAEDHTQSSADLEVVTGSTPLTVGVDWVGTSDAVGVSASFR